MNKKRELGYQIHIFKVNGDKLRRADAELCEFPFNQFQHDRFPAAVNTDHGLDQLRPNKRANALHINCDELFVINQRFPKNIHTCTKDIAEQFDLKQAIKIPNLFIFTIRHVTCVQSTLILTFLRHFSR